MTKMTALAEFQLQFNVAMSNYKCPHVTFSHTRILGYWPALYEQGMDETSMDEHLALIIVHHRNYHNNLASFE